MAKLREAPIDSRQIPLPIIPSENFPNAPSDAPNLTKHHEYFLYGKQTFISLGGRALRGSRLLRVEPEVHSQGRKSFHRFYDMSPGPSTEQGRFDVCIYSGAGYIPEEGIDLWSGSPVRRKMEDGERQILSTLNQKNPLYYQNLIRSIAGIRPFFDKFILKQGFDLVSEPDIENFNSTPKFGSVRDSGHILLQGLVESAILPIRESYHAAKTAGLLHPEAPNDPADVAINILGKEHQREERLFPSMRRHLIRQLQIGSKAVQTEVDRVELVA